MTRFGTLLDRSDSVPTLSFYWALLSPTHWYVSWFCCSSWSSRHHYTSLLQSSNGCCDLLRHHRQGACFHEVVGLVPVHPYLGTFGESVRIFKESKYMSCLKERKILSLQPIITNQFMLFNSLPYFVNPKRSPIFISQASFEHIDYWLQQLEQHGDEGVQRRAMAGFFFISWNRSRQWKAVKSWLVISICAFRVLVGNKADLNENRKAGGWEWGQSAQEEVGSHFHDGFWRSLKKKDKS